MRKRCLKITCRIFLMLFVLLGIADHAYCDCPKPLVKCIQNTTDCPDNYEKADTKCCCCCKKIKKTGCPNYPQGNGKKCDPDAPYCTQGYECSNVKDDLWCCLKKKTVIELSLFEASSDKGKVTVHWITESEKNTAGFDIERSLLPHKGYEKINIVMIPAEGDEITGAEYSFVDTNTKREKYYYQLKEYELNGTVNHYGPTEIDLRPKGKTKTPKAKKTSPAAEKNILKQEDKTTEQEKITTEQSPLPIEIDSSDAGNKSTEEKKIPYVLAGQKVSATAKKPLASPKGWIKTPFSITETGKDKGVSRNKKKNILWHPTTAEQKADGPAKTITWSEEANVIYVSQRNFSNKDLFLKLLDGKLIVVNKTNPEYFRFADTIENERQLTERLKEIGVHDTKSILTIWRESHENKQ